MRPAELPQGDGTLAEPTEIDRVGQRALETSFASARARTVRLSVAVSSTVVFKDETVEYHWTFSGTNAGPGGTGVSVRISGFEEWTFGDDLTWTSMR